MYLHPGGNHVIRADDIIGIFDIDKTTVSKRSREFLNKKEKQNIVILLDDDLPQSFIVTAKKDRERVYLSQISSKTLYLRLSEE
ncbi:MAG: DUF370 domain-containing protein [Clostridia bacterium]|nr:DUF370 domain-containing protein [Clostridia bacterium]